MGSAQTSSVQSEVMEIESDHFLNWELQDYQYNEDYYVSSISVSDYHTQAPNYPYCAWEVDGAHYFERLNNPPYFLFLGYSYAYDGLL